MVMPRAWGRCPDIAPTRGTYKGNEMLATLINSEIDLVGGGVGPGSRALAIDHSFNTGGTSVGSFNLAVKSYSFVYAAPGSSVSVTNNISVGITIGSTGGLSA